MTGNFKKIFVDTSPIIYLLDKSSPFCSKTKKIFDLIFNKSSAAVITSSITCTEYLVYPYRTKNLKAENAFLKFLNECQIDICNIDITTAIKAAKIRAEYPHFKTPDALQLAAAIINDCDLFLTNDKQLKNFKEITCATVEEWSFEE